MKTLNILPDCIESLLLHADEVSVFQIEMGQEWLSPRIEKHTIVSCVVLSKATQQDFVAAIVQGIAENEDISRCSHPHHALRAKMGYQVLEMVICFSCDWIRAALGEEDFSFSTSRRAEPCFDAYFPEYAASRDMWTRISDLTNETKAYSLPIPARLQQSLKFVNELQQELTDNPNLRDHARMMKRLQELKANLLKKLKS